MRKFLWTAARVATLCVWLCGSLIVLVFVPSKPQAMPMFARKSRRPTLGVGGPYKPMAKGDRVGRESEGFVVPLTLLHNSSRGKEPCFGYGRVWR